MTAEELAARVREDVDRNGDLIRKREDARSAIDNPSPILVSTREKREMQQDVATAALVASARGLMPATNTPTESILGKAHRLVQGRRGAEYGHPLDNHGATAEMFAAYLQRKYGLVVPLDADDVCWFNIFQKGSRDANEPGIDNLVDTAGYAFNLELIRAERARRSTPQKPL